MTEFSLSWDEIQPIAGIRLGVAAASVKYTERNDIVVVEIAEGANVAAVFTQNAFCAAPVKIAREHLSKHSVRYLIINSGNANACTGQSGYLAALDVCQSLADIKDVLVEQVLPFSTGVIGEILPAKKIINALPSAIENLSDAHWHSSAQAIMTTDTRAKGVSKTLINDSVTITGIAKGAGMIKPNMATMLAFVATDLAVEPQLLNQISKIASNKSFNRITIDGDTSTNDACVIIATGKSLATPLLSDKDPRYEEILQSVIDVYQDLAQQIVYDGEGATKFVEIIISSGLNQQECLNVAYRVAHSPLVKTALYASDPNWGRLVAAIGDAGISQLDAESVKVWVNDLLIVENGGAADGYTEELAQQIFNQDKFTLSIDLSRGEAREVLWTTDLSHEYIKINAEYRT